MRGLLRAVLIALLSLASLTCEDAGVDPGPPARIVLGESIEGIHLGDMPEQVKQVLGPFGGHGWADGVDRGWRLWLYDRDGLNKPGLEVWFLGMTDDSQQIPVDYVVATRNYQGKSREGIGIGTRIAHLLQVLGASAKVYPAEDSAQVSVILSCYKETNMEFHVKGDTVYLLALGPRTPSRDRPACN